MSRWLKIGAAIGAIALLAVGYFVFTERGQDLLLEKLTSAAAAATFPPGRRRPSGLHVRNGVANAH